MANPVLINLEEVFDKLSHPPFIANNISLDSEEDKLRFNDLIYTKYDGENLKLTAQCNCGKVKGDFRIDEYCDVCQTVCKPQYSGKIESAVWMVAHPTTIGFITPIVWQMLTTAYRIRGVDVIRWLCDPYMKVPTRKLPEKVVKLISKGHKRGYKYFTDNFFEIIDELSLNKAGKVVKRYQPIYELLHSNKDKIFTKYLPAPAKMALVLERNNSGNYFDKSLFPAIDAVILATEMGALPPDVKYAKIESKMVNIIDRMATFIKNFSTELLTGKEGIFRKHYFAGRLHFSARQVITSNHGVHGADELIIPWTCAVNLFTEHLRSKLLKPPYSMPLMDAYNLVVFATNNYNSLIDKLLNEIIVEDSPWKGFPCLFSRPPILTRGSVQFFYITGYSKNPAVNTIKISPLVLKMPNAD